MDKDVRTQLIGNTVTALTSLLAGISGLWHIQLVRQMALIQGGIVVPLETTLLAFLARLVQVATHPVKNLACVGGVTGPHAMTTLPSLTNWLSRFRMSFA